MHMPALHEAEHLARKPTDLQRFEIKLPLERIQRPHDVGDRPKPVCLEVRCLCRLRSLPYAGIGFFDDLLTEVDANQIVLKEVMVEHELGRFAEIQDPVADWRR